MKINFPTLFQTSLSSYRFFFIFGNDPTTFERAISFLQTKFSSSLKMQTEGNLLNSTVFQQSLFDDFSLPLTFVPHVTDKILNQIPHLREGIFIFTSEKARAHSKLVTYFTQATDGLAIAAYASPLTSLEFESMTEGIFFSEIFKRQLFTTYQNDYRGLLSTLQKIKLFGTISEEYYKAFLDPHSSCDDLFSLLEPFLLRDLKSAAKTLSFLASSDLISFVRMLTRSFLTLCDIMPFKELPQAIAWQKLTPPVFFKDQPLFESALSRWKMKDVHSFLETLLYLEHKVKYSAFSLPQVSQGLLKHLHEKSTDKNCFT